MKNLLILFCLFSFTTMWAQPTTNAPTPPMRSAGDVISIYGDAYTNIDMINYNPGWGQSGDVNINFDPGTGDLVMAYTNFNYQGTSFEANPQNASAMEFVHIDIWTSNATAVLFSPIDNSGTGIGEFLVNVPLVANEWSSVDLPKAAFEGMTWNSVFQLKFDGQSGVSPSDIYLDNIYFWKSPVTSGSDATLSSIQINGNPLQGFNGNAFEYNVGVRGGADVPMITEATTTDASAMVTSITQAASIPGDATIDVTAADGTTMATYTISFFYNSPSVGAPVPNEVEVISLFSDSYTDVLVDTWSTPWGQATYYADTIDGNPTHRYTNTGFIGVETTTTPVDISNMNFLHMDVWSPNMNKINVKIVSFLGDGFQGANGDSEVNIDVPLVKNEWNEIKIPIDSLTARGLTGLDDINQYIFTSDPFGSGTLFIDNVIFSTGVTNTGDLSEPNLVVYPNPVSSNQVLQVNEEVQSMRLYDISGRVVQLSTTNQLALQSLNSGIYVLKIDLPGQKTIARKIVVQ